MRLKLFIDTQSKRVIVAEANDEFANFLDRMLSFWVAACVPKKFDPQVVLTGSLANLYSSFKNDLHEFYRQPNRVSHICPKLYKCTKSRCCFVSDDGTMRCPKHSCGLEYVPRAPVDKSTLTYTVTDDLKVECGASTSAVMELFRQYGVKDFASVEEEVVHLSEDEALEMLEASRNSQTVLTDVFLEKKKIAEKGFDGAESRMLTDVSLEKKITEKGPDGAESRALQRRKEFMELWSSQLAHPHPSSLFSRLV